MTDPSSSVDLSPILKRLMANTRVREATRRRLANDEKTKALLEAGLRLLTGDHDDELEAREGEASSRPYLWFSIRQVLEEANREWDDGRELTPSTLQDRWPSRPDFDEDLIAYALVGSHGLTQFTYSDEIRRLLVEGDFTEAVHHVSYQYVRQMMDSLGFRATLASAVMTRYDPAVDQANDEVYKVITEKWSRLYGDVIEARGLKLRPGISLTDFTHMLTALADGVGLRMLTDSAAGVDFVDHTSQHSFLGRAVVALAVACFDPGDGMSHEELLKTLMNGGETAAGSP